MTHDPSFIGFGSLDAALEFQVDHGGWVFDAQYAEEAIWFPPTTPPTKIMLHPATRGYSGRLLSDPADHSTLSFQAAPKVA